MKKPTDKYLTPKEYEVLSFHTFQDTNRGEDGTYQTNRGEFDNKVAQIALQAIGKLNDFVKWDDHE